MLLEEERQIKEYIRRQRAGPEPLQERVRRFCSYLPALYWAAEDMREIGATRQYRGFGVGAAVLAFRPNGFYRQDHYKIFAGHNSKERPDGPKCCAERRALENALAEGYVMAVGLAIVAPYQPDDTSGHECIVLHPCLDCRVMMAYHRLTWWGMPIVSCLPPPKEIHPTWVPTHRAHTLGEILHIHGNRTP